MVLHCSSSHALKRLASLLTKGETLQGTVVCIPVVNVYGYLAQQRDFRDGQDLNRNFPGKPKGNPAQQFVYNFLHRVLSRFEFLVDLHTASFGRANSMYIRCDLASPVINRMAYLMVPLP